MLKSEATKSFFSIYYKGAMAKQLSKDQDFKMIPGRKVEEMIPMIGIFVKSEKEENIMKE